VAILPPATSVEPGGDAQATADVRDGQQLRIGHGQIATVAAEIEAAIRHNAHFDSHQINVDVNGAE
jgi:hypothetical protein